jgi:hypothetical protein
MRITIQREKTFESTVCPGVKITFKVPSAEKYEKYVSGNGMNNTAIYRDAILKIEGLEDESGNPITEKDLPTLPNTWALIQEIAFKVVAETKFTVSEKN